MKIYATATILVALWAGPVAASPMVRRRLKTVTLSQLQSNNSPSSCWIQIDGNAYDVTSYPGMHPGGSSAIEKSCGKDITNKFFGRKEHSAQFLTILPQVVLQGAVVAAPPPTPAQGAVVAAPPPTPAQAAVVKPPVPTPAQVVVANPPPLQAAQEYDSEDESSDTSSDSSDD